MTAVASEPIKTAAEMREAAAREAEIAMEAPAECQRSIRAGEETWLQGRPERAAWAIDFHAGREDIARDIARRIRALPCDDETERLPPLTPEGERLLREGGFRTDVAEVERLRARLRRLEEAGIAVVIDTAILAVWSGKRPASAFDKLAAALAEREGGEVG